MKMTKEIFEAIETGKCKVKRIEAKAVSPEFRKDSAWLEAIYDVINRTGLAIRDEIECMQQPESAQLQEELLDGAKEIVRDFNRYGEMLQTGDNGEYGMDSAIGRLNTIVNQIEEG